MCGFGQKRGEMVELSRFPIFFPFPTVLFFPDLPRFYRLSFQLLAQTSHTR